MHRRPAAAFRPAAAPLLAALLSAAPASAAVYAVGPTREFKDLGAVAGRLAPGDTVRVDGGAVYPAALLTRSGTRAAPIVLRGLRAADGSRPRLSGGTNTLHLRADWHVVEGFEITGGSARCVFHEGADNVLRDALVRDCPKQGILGADQGSGSFTLEHSEVRGCGGGDRDHQIYMTTDQVGHPGSVFRLRHCWIHDAKGGNNVKSRSERNEIHYNWIEGGYYHELELIGPDPAGVADGWSPRLEREDSDVVGNVFWKRRTAAGNDSDFAVFRIGGDGTGASHGRYRFVNNTVIAGRGAIFRCFDSLQSAEMHNNVFHRPGGGLNLMRVADAAWTEGRAVVAGTRNWVTAGAANLPAGWTGTLQGADPGFADLAGGDLRPAPGSPLLDAGAVQVRSADGFDFPDPLFPPVRVPAGRSAPASPPPRPVQGALDIGAYEAGSLSALRAPAQGPRRRSGATGSAASPAVPWGKAPLGATPELRTLDGRRVE